MPLPPTLESEKFRLKEATLLTFERGLLADLENLTFIRYKAREHPTPNSKKAIPTDRLRHFPVEGSFTLKFVRESADETLSQQRQDALAQFIVEGRLTNPFQEKRAVLEVVTIGERTYSQLRRIMVGDRPLKFEAQKCRMQNAARIFIR
jgi:hypothetical protein